MSRRDASGTAKTSAKSPPATTAPVNGKPATTAPANGKPATTAPANGKPATTAPANGKPATTAPANGKPATTAPANGKPATTAPANGKPATTPAANGTSSATSAASTAAEWWVQDQPRARKARPGRRYRVVGLVASAAVLVAAGSVAYVQLSAQNGHNATAPSASQLRAQAAARSLAATWIAAQVSHGAVVACDPVMCKALQAHRFPGAQLLQLGPAAPYPVSAAVVVATPAVRNQFGSSLAAAYAPVVLASFGTGIARIDIRVIAPHGAAAYVAALKADVTARKQYAVPLLQSGRFDVLPLAARQLKAGQVDTRLLIATAGIAPSGPMIIQDFGTSAPGASPGVPLRYVDLTMTDRAPLTRSSPFVQSVLKQLSRQSGQQFRPAHVQLVRSGGQLNVLRIEFPAPSPLGLFGPG